MHWLGLELNFGLFFEVEIIGGGTLKLKQCFGISYSKLEFFADLSLFYKEKDS